MKRYQLLAISGLLVTLTLSGCAMTSVRQHQDVDMLSRKIGSVVIVPPDVDIKLLAFDGDNQDLVEKEDSVKKAIIDIAKTRLANESLEVIDFDFEAAMAEDQEFAYAVTQCVQAWNTAKNEMYEKAMVSDEAKGTFRTSLGSVANAITEKTGADSILLMHYAGFEKSGGMIAKDIATSTLLAVVTAGAYIPVQSTSGAYIDLAIVDTHGGNVLWANRKNAPNLDAALATTALGELPNMVWKSELNGRAAPLSDAVHTPEVEVANTDAL